MPFAGGGCGSDAMGTAWETHDKPALPPSLAQSCFLSTGRAGPQGFARAVQILSLPQSQARNLFPGAWRVRFLQGKDQSGSFLQVLPQPLGGACRSGLRTVGRNLGLE